MLNQTFNKEVFYQSLGRQINELRKKNDYTLDLLNEAANLQASKSVLSEIESGKQKILPHQLYLICQYFGVTADKLLNQAMIEAEEIKIKEKITDSELTELKNITG